ncbi:hypothetical protein Y032_0004g2090 [Ancylostoma ceylanicum]|uniref:Cysteine-rich transmembrane CYSTM domain-containing protein n=1 Tax=Ancylostoma ceylanicum TaxID=53326 RepID=A0A016VW96_9BILA|nr:hypothetical protein Y032_0004g2090 [Ancylostoma ceylanicum]
MSAEKNRNSRGSGESVERRRLFRKGSYPRRVEPYPYQPQMYASAPTASPYYYSHSYASPYSQPCYGYSPYPPPAYYPYPPNTVYVQRDTGIDPCLACCWATLAVCCCCCWCN